MIEEPLSAAFEPFQLVALYEQLYAIDTLEELQGQFPTELSCIPLLYQLKWPTGFICPRCQHSHAYKIQTRRLPLFECCACRHQTSLIAGTIMERSRTPLHKWFTALWLVSRSDIGIHAVRLSSIIQVTYKTAWLMLHKIRVTMGRADSLRPLSGKVHGIVAFYGHHATRQYNLRVYPLFAAASVSPIEDSIKNTTKDTTRDATKDTSRDVNKDTSRDVNKDNSKKLIEDTARETTKDTNRNSTEDSAEEIGELKMKIWDSVFAEHTGTYRPRRLPLRSDCEHFIQKHISSTASDVSIIRQKYRVRCNNPLYLAFKKARGWINETFHGIGIKYLQTYLDEYCFRYNLSRRYISPWIQLLRLCMKVDWKYPKLNQLDIETNDFVLNHLAS